MGSKRIHLCRDGKRKRSKMREYDDGQGGISGAHNQWLDDVEEETLKRLDRSMRCSVGIRKEIEKRRS